MSGVKNKSVKKEQKIIEDEFLEDGEVLEDKEKFWEEMNLNKEKRRWIKNRRLKWKNKIHE
jgi:hypothetical protein